MHGPRISYVLHGLSSSLVQHICALFGRSDPSSSDISPSRNKQLPTSHIEDRPEVVDSEPYSVKVVSLRVL